MKKVLSETIGSWEIKKQEAGFVYLSRQVPVMSDYLDVSGNYWTVSIIDNIYGAMGFSSFEQKIPIPLSKLLVSVPPFSTYMVSSSQTVQFNVLISLEKPFSFLPNFPVMFPCSDNTKPEEILDINTIKKRIQFDQNTDISYSNHISGIGKKIKQYLDEHYLYPITLSEVSKRLGIASYNLTRYYKQSYKMTPCYYLKNIRITSAVVAMLFENKGKSILESFSTTGFNDLSRFNKQFKEKLGFTPKKMKQK